MGPGVSARAAEGGAELSRLLLRDGLLQHMCDMFLWLHHHIHELLCHG